MTEGSHKDRAHRDNETLQEVKPYIDAVVRNIVPTTFSYDDREDLAQKSWIKYWQSTQERKISYPKAYIRHIVHSEFITMIRKRSRLTLLVVSDDGELDPDQGNILVEESEGMGNPERVFEQKAAADERMEEAMQALKALPERQRQAITATLWEKLDTLIPFIDSIGRHDLEMTRWPANQVEKQRLQASRPPALKHMAQHMGINLHNYKHWHRQQHTLLTRV